MVRLTVLLVGGLCALLLNMCSGVNNPVTGVVQAEVAGRTIVVTECYRLEMPRVEPLPKTDSGVETWRFAPCRDAVILIAGDQLSVNGIPYGAVAPGDEILVDQGDVYVNGQLRQMI
jgi:hypothetical protein